MAGAASYPFDISTSGYVGPLVYGSGHLGVDFWTNRNAVGTPPGNNVYLPYDGTFRGYFRDPRGTIQALVLEHNISQSYAGVVPFLHTYTLYFHMANERTGETYVNLGLRYGSSYGRGTLLGRQGNRLWTTGSVVVHLHFDISTTSSESGGIDPSPYLGLRLRSEDRVPLWYQVWAQAEPCPIPPGTGSSRVSLFQQAYNRMGRSAMSCATSSAFWWFGMVRQDFYGHGDFGAAAILHDEPHDADEFGHWYSVPAYVVHGGIWDWYRYNPWYGPAASDEYINAFGRAQSDFRDGFIYWTGVVNPRRYLLKGSRPEVYLVERGTKRWISNPETLFALGYSWADLQVISDAELGIYPTGVPIPDVNVAWLAQYYDNRVWLRPSKVARAESEIDFNWGFGSPDPTVPTDNFSATLSRYFDFIGGEYEFVVNVDDGVWFYLDGNLLFFHGLGFSTFTRNIPAGRHLVQVRYRAYTWTDYLYLSFKPKDVEAPVTALSFDPAEPNGENDWYISDVTVTLLVTDPSGIERTEYNLGTGWITYTGPFVISQEGTTEILYRSIDKVGNVEETQSAVVGLDKTLPMVVIGGPYSGEEGSAVGFDGSASSDEVSGIQSYTWEFIPQVEGQETPQPSVYASYTWGDNSSFTASLSVEDMAGWVAEETTTASITNISPTVILDRSVMILFPADEALLTKVGQSFTLEDNVTDPGSDDLELTFDFGEGVPQIQTFLNDPEVGPDPLPSPEINPREVTSLASYEYQDPGIYRPALTVTDDDSGEGLDQDYAVVQDDGTVGIRTMGFWKYQFGVGEGQGNLIPQETLERYLEIADFLTNIYSDLDAVQAKEILTKDEDGNPMRERAGAQYLALLLNFASGSIDWDQLVDTNFDGISDTIFSEAVFEIDAVLSNPDSTGEELEVVKDIADSINNMGN